MIPVELELLNFLAYRAPGPLNFEGIQVACLSGPNGAGKSSLLDALTWALWGRARTNAPDELIHQGQTEMQVSLTFDQDGARYKVIRQRRAGKRAGSLLEFQGWDESTGEWRSLSEGSVRQTQDRIQSLLRLDYDTFVNSAFLAQGRADEFTTKTPAQRKQVLANILGLGQWERLEDMARQRAAEVQGALQRLEGQLEEIDRELARRGEYEAELVQAEAAAREEEARLMEAERAWSDLEKARGEVVRLQRQIDDLTRRIASADRDVAEAERERETARRHADRAAHETLRQELRQQLGNLEGLEARTRELQDGRLEVQQEAAHLRGLQQALGPETEPLKARAALLESSSAPSCPTCGQPLDESHRQRLVRELQEEVENRRAQFREQQARIRELEGRAGAMEKDLRELERQTSERRALEKRMAELEAALAQAGEAAALAARLEEAVARRKAERTAWDQERAGLEAEVNLWEGRLAAAAVTPELLERLRREKRLADERVGGARQKLAALEAFDREREQRVHEWARRNDELGLLQELRVAFSKRGVPAMIIETAVPELERSANETLSGLTDNQLHVRIQTQREIKTGDLREALNIVISDDLGSRAYELYSGGEGFRIDFAIRIALSRLLARRAGARLRSLFIDEGFGTQDARGREQLVAAIRRIQDQFDRILVITHVEEMKDAFPIRIEVEKTPQGSMFRFA